MKLLTNEAISRYSRTDSKNIGKDNFIIRLDAVAEAQIRSTDVEIRIRKDNTMKKRKINKEEEMKKLKKVGGLVARVCQGPVGNRTRLDAIVEVQTRDMDVIEKMKFIAARIKEVADETIELLPEEYRDFNYDMKWDALCDLQYELVSYKHLFEGIGEYLGEARRKIFSADKEQLEPRVHNEFSEIKDAEMFMADMDRMMLVLMMNIDDFENPTEVMDRLLKLVDAALHKIAEFWKKWKKSAVDTEQSIPLMDVLKRIYGSEEKAKAYYPIQERLLPELIAMEYVTYFDADYELYKVIEDRWLLEEKEEDYLHIYYTRYLHGLYRLEYDCFDNNIVPIKKRYYLS